MVDPVFLAFLAGAAGFVAYAVRHRAQRNRTSLLTFARKRKGKLRTSDEVGVVVEVRGIPVTIDFGIHGLRAQAPFALGFGPEGEGHPGPFDSEYFAGLGAESDRPKRLGARLSHSYRWSGEHRWLKPFVASAASALSSTAVTIPTFTCSQLSVTVEHPVGESRDLEELADGLAELAAAIACWQMPRVEEAAKQLRAPVVMRSRGDRVEPECTTGRVRFVFQLSAGLQPQALVVRASVHCDPRIAYDGKVDATGASPPLPDEAVSTRARELLRGVGTCRLQMRERHEASLTWPEASSAEELEQGALFLQAVATKRDVGGAFR